MTNTPKGYIIKIPLGGIYKEVLQMEDKTCCCHKTKERTEEEVKKQRLDAGIVAAYSGHPGNGRKKRLLYGHLGTVSGSLRRHERL